MLISGSRFVSCFVEGWECEETVTSPVVGVVHQAVVGRGGGRALL